MSIRDRIAARADLTDMVSSRDLDGLAEALNQEGATAICRRWVTGRTILSECTDGEAILAALEAASEDGSVATRWVVGFLGAEPGVDMGNQVTRAKTIQLAEAGALSADQAQQLLDLADMPLVVTRLEVESAMFNPDGGMK